MSSHFLFLLEIIFLLIITYQDEKDMEFSAALLIGLFSINIIKLYINPIIPIKSVFLAIIIEFTIFIISKNSYGLGDVLINIILSLNFESAINYFYFFTLQFIIGAIYSIIYLVNGHSIKSKIPFTKFILISYIFSGVYKWITIF